MNPYAPPGVSPHESVVRLQHATPTASQFWLKHLVTFQLSFIVVWFALICMNLGFAKTVKELLTAPHDLLVMVAFGIGVWVPHAMLALAYRKMRRIHSSATALTGSTFFLIGMACFELLTKFLPRNMSMSLSWTPTFVLLALYLALSLAAVLLVVWLRSDQALDS